MSLHRFLRSLLNVLIQISNEIALQRNVSEVALPGQRIWNFFGNRLVEAHIYGNAQSTCGNMYLLCGSSVAA
jgi:hypothetical protein